MNRYYFLTVAAGLLSCFTVGVSHPGKSRRALRSDEAWVICSRFTQLPSKAFPGNTTSVCFRNLSSIASDDLKIFPQLRQLSLISNQLRTLPADLLKGLSKLHILDLTGNNLTSLSSRVFHHSPLVELILSGNLLSEVDPDCLPVNSSLQRLDLSSNRFTQLPVAFLQRLSNLESLDFSNNQLEELTPGALTSLSKLEALYLENNRLKFIDPLSFSGNPNLEQIFLSGNRLASLPTKLFLKQDKLVFLDLRNNYLQSLTPGTLDGLVVHTVLSGNPWHCNSSLAYLWHWLHMNEKRLFHYDKITCQTPEHMKGRNIMDIAAIELGIKE